MNGLDPYEHKEWSGDLKKLPQVWAKIVSVRTEMFENLSSTPWPFIVCQKQPMSLCTICPICSWKTRGSIDQQVGTFIKIKQVCSSCGHVLFASVAATIPAIYTAEGDGRRTHPFWGLQVRHCILMATNYIDNAIHMSTFPAIKRH
ncbi:hypothetical protein N1851_003751 [Merluccius polli]|uniref:Uncharacterized protein n=1 Tax=Merluccius polli TaxID=89951 RepID=A0AA47N9I0_MERPO|nr:hypothetical protein N1851_003751 [Merluccius polli]